MLCHQCNRPTEKCDLNPVCDTCLDRIEASHNAFHDLMIQLDIAITAPNSSRKLAWNQIKAIMSKWNT